MNCCARQIARKLLKLKRLRLFTPSQRVSAFLHGVQGVPSSNLGVPTNFPDSISCDSTHACPPLTRALTRQVDVPDEHSIPVDRAAVGQT